LSILIIKKGASQLGPGGTLFAYFDILAQKKSHQALAEWLQKSLLKSVGESGNFIPFPNIAFKIDIAYYRDIIGTVLGFTTK